MSVHNDENFLGAAIESILGQECGDFEFLIVDDGSSDRSGAIIDEYAGRDARIRAIHQENRGLIASLNRLLDEARAPLIARMDGDDIALPARFARQLEFLDAHPDHGLVGANVHDIDDAGTVRECTWSHPLDHDAILVALRDRSPICHPTVMLRRDLVRALGGYRPAFRHCEDFDLWLRLADRTRLANLPDRLLYYRRSASQVSVRHTVAQQTGAAVALLCRRERLAGRRDPADGLAALPPIDALDTLFGRAGTAAEVQARLARQLGYSPRAMREDGFGILVDHVRGGGETRGMWKTVVRLVLFNQLARALRLAALLLAHRLRAPHRA